MLSDISSLTDLSSDEGDRAYVPAKKRGRPSANAKPYQLQNCLRPPRTATYSVKAIYDQIRDGSINLNPEYQRDVVWPQTKMTGLIDSVLRNYYVPPIIFAVSRSDDGIEKRTCIDGKQRLTSIKKFMDGVIPHKDSRTSVKYWYKKHPSVAGKLLPPQYCNQFANKQVVCVEYELLDEDAEREIFQRVQLGVALTPAERLQAIPGPWSACIRDVQSKILGDEGFGQNLDWASGRGRDFQCICSIVWLVEKDNPSFPGCPTLEKWLTKVTPPTAEFKQRITDVFTVFVALVNDKTYNRAFQKPTRVSPVEFVLAGVFIDRYMATMSLSQLAQGITKMRENVRKTFVDVRANSRVVKHGMVWMTDKVPADLQRLETGDIPAAQAVKAQKKKTSGGSIRRERVVIGKRKRQVYVSSESEDSDEEPAPPPKPIAPKPKAAKKSTKGNPRPTKAFTSTNTTVATPAQAPTSNDPSGSGSAIQKAPSPRTASSKTSSPVMPTRPPIPSPSTEQMLDSRRSSGVIGQSPQIPGLSNTTNAQPLTPQIGSSTSTSNVPLTVNTRLLPMQSPPMSSGSAVPSYFPRHEDIKPSVLDTGSPSGFVTNGRQAWDHLTTAKTHNGTPTTPMTPFTPMPTLASSYLASSSITSMQYAQQDSTMGKDPRKGNVTIRRPTLSGQHSSQHSASAAPSSAVPSRMLPPTTIPHHITVGRHDVPSATVSQATPASHWPVPYIPSQTPVSPTPASFSVHSATSQLPNGQQAIQQGFMTPLAPPSVQQPQTNTVLNSQLLQQMSESVRSMSKEQQTQFLSSIVGNQATGLQQEVDHFRNQPNSMPQSPDTSVARNRSQYPATIPQQFQLNAIQQGAGPSSYGYRYPPLTPPVTAEPPAHAQMHSESLRRMSISSETALQPSLTRRSPTEIASAFIASVKMEPQEHENLFATQPTIITSGPGSRNSPIEIYSPPVPPSSSGSYRAGRTTRWGPPTNNGESYRRERSRSRSGSRSRYKDRSYANDNRSRGKDVERDEDDYYPRRQDRRESGSSSFPYRDRGKSRPGNVPRGPRTFRSRSRGSSYNRRGRDMEDDRRSYR